MIPSRCNIENQAYAGSFLFATGQADRAAETLHYSFDQHQTDAQAALFGGEKRFENHSLLLLAHAFASITQG
ncbi:hypothetical protein D3C75_1169490 [compost metagenome]